jgi:hypothetical protein
MGAIIVGIACFGLMIFMKSMDNRFGDFMGMIAVLTLVGLASLAVIVIAGCFIIPILLAIAVPVFIAWFCFWLIRQLFESPKEQLGSKRGDAWPWR